MLIKETKAQVRARVRKTGEWTGYIVGNNVAECHVVGGWALGFPVTLVNVPGGWVGVKGRENTTLDDLLYEWAYYNANHETGYRPAFYRVAKR